MDRPSLDLSDLLPDTVMVRAKNADGSIDEIFEVQTDILPVMQTRIAAWLRSYQAMVGAEPGAEEVSMPEFYAIVADLTGCDVATAERIGFKAGVRLMSFLAKPLGALAQTMASSDQPSISPTPSAAP